MGLQIEGSKDGGGIAAARYSSKSRLKTDAITFTRAEDATVSAKSYNLNTGLITLTSAAESGILYIKNTSTTDDLYIEQMVVILGPSTGGSATDTTRVRIYRNPTTGTLISGASAADIEINRNFKSGATFTGDVYKGATGNTITDGSVYIDSLVSPGNRVAFGIDTILGTDDTVAVSYEPNDSNTSMKVMCAVNCYFETRL